ncbi:MrcB family domain-containing protein [Pseudonocardia hierapolitana]|uniref:MrcB family domain-containing protein n=1 Tax=Pseudonocardia hierapolitana TaxID=1128676 RepID=UPI003CCC537D
MGTKRRSCGERGHPLVPTGLSDGPHTIAAVDLKGALLGVVTYGYRHVDERQQPAQEHLRRSKQQLPDLLPPGMRALVSGSGQSLPVVPWIAILDPDVTTTAKEGLYIVYLYSADLSRLYLSNESRSDATQRQCNASRAVRCRR